MSTPVSFAAPSPVSAPVTRFLAIVALSGIAVAAAVHPHTADAAPMPAAPASAPPASPDDAAPKPEEAGMWIGTAAVVCLEQDATLKATPFGRQMTESPAYAAWHAEQHPAVLACLAQARLLAPALCHDIFAQDPEKPEDHSRALYDKHAATIAHLSRLDDCTSR